MPLWLGLDFGTSAAKALLVDDAGTVHARATARYGTSFGRDGAAEQDPSAYLAATRELAAACGAAGAPAGVGLVGHSPSQVFVDRDGRAARPAVTWQDVRARDEAAEIAERLGDPVPHLGSWIPWAPMYPAPKLLWLARHERGLVDRTRWVLAPKDYVGLWLTGEPVSDPWTSRGLCNVETGAVAAEVLRAAGWPPSVVPELAPAWTTRGKVTPNAARASGLPAGIPVAVGWSDALAATLAIGAFERPTAFLVTGTADVVGLSTTDAPSDAKPLFTVPALCAPLPLVYGATQSSGAAIAWARSMFPASDGAPGERPAPPESGRADLAFVPYLSGERAPVWRDDVRGVLLGLGLEHSGADVLRAVEIGVACSGRDVLEEAERIVARRADDVLIGGAGAAERAAVDTRVTVLGRRVTVMTEAQASALGAAMLAAAAAGAPLDAVARAMRSPSEQVEPTGNQVRYGHEAFTRYQRARAVSVEWADAAQRS